MSNDSSRSFSLSLFVDAALALLGLSFSAYALRHHLTFKASGMTNAVCNVNDVVSCDAAAASPYSEVAGIPLGVYGIAFFTSLLVFNVMRAAASRGGFVGRVASQTHAVMVLVGVAVSIVLAIISAVSVKAFCLVCSGIYLVNILLAVSMHRGRAQLARPFRKGAVAVGGLIAFSITGISGWSYTQFVSTSKPKGLNPQSAQSLIQGDQARPSMAPRAARQLPLSRSPYSGAGEDYRHGNEQAKVVVQEFVDFQCPGCAVLAATIKELKVKYGSRVLFVFRNYPLDNKCNHNISGMFHAHACAIATMARCAGQYGKFWEYAELAFSKQAEASAENAVKWARSTGLSQEAIDTCQKSQDILNKLRDDVALADQLGVTGTPTLFINGIRYDGDRGAATLSQVLDSALIEAQQ
jgi:protein-disulfide isomerase/uncharacterized membrane protein